MSVWITLVFAESIDGVVMLPFDSGHFRVSDILGLYIVL